MNWKTNQHVLDICCVFSDWIEDGGVRVAFDCDGCVIHEDGRKIEDWAGVGGDDPGDDENELDSHFGVSDPEVALVSLFDA